MNTTVLPLNLKTEELTKKFIAFGKSDYCAQFVYMIEDMILADFTLIVLEIL